MIKMVEKLNEEDHDWRKNTVVMVDNAQYHRSEVTKSLIKTLNIPFMFMGPY